jgi:hypothetical protein
LSDGAIARLSDIAASCSQPIEIIGAGEGNRTLVISLEGCCSTIELHPQSSTSQGLPRSAHMRKPVARVKYPKSCTSVEII